jgi:excisionase family DNA binding protein
VAEVAKRLDVPAALVRRWIADGDLPACRTASGRLHLDRRAVDDVITPRPQRSLTIEEAIARVRNPPTLSKEEVARRHMYWDMVAEHRKHRPSIAPLTTADLVHMGRRPEYDRTFDPD